MKLRENSGGNFEPCPEYTGRAVCVDVTPTKRVTTQYGERDQFRLVFEVDAQLSTGQRAAVWSKGFTPSLHEKSGFRHFLRNWLGRDLTDQERAEFETESLVGKPAFLVVVHAQVENDIYANIASCTPDKSGNPLQPSGAFVRAKDRQNGTGASPKSHAHQPQTTGRWDQQKTNGNNASSNSSHSQKSTPDAASTVDDNKPFTVNGITLVESWTKDGTTNGRKWRAFFFKTQDDICLATYDTNIAELANSIKEGGDPCDVTVKKGRKEGIMELMDIEPISETKSAVPANEDDVPF